MHIEQQWGGSSTVFPPQLRSQAIVAAKQHLDRAKQATLALSPRTAAIQRQPTHCLTQYRCYYSPAPAWEEQLFAFLSVPIFGYPLHGIIMNLLSGYIQMNLGFVEPAIRRIDRRFRL